jgi:hypothetical protein
LGVALGRDESKTSIQARWWTQDPTEQYWCEITNRLDLGGDLKCPQADDAGEPYWSYGLIHEVSAGEIVFHYSIRERAFVGASVAGAPVEDRPIVWAPRGTSGRAAKHAPEPRAGWWRPLYGYTSAKMPLTLAELNTPENQAWVRQWIAARGKGAMAPLQAYPRALRGAQGYLTKLPREWVSRWAGLSSLADALEGIQLDLAPLTSVAPNRVGRGDGLSFKPKSAEDYVAVVRAQRQVKTRHHERLVTETARRLSESGATVSNPHPIDLLMTAPSVVMFEAKALGDREPSAGVREAIGQLLEYRHYLGPPGAALCILLDRAPPAHVIEFVEEALGMMIAWVEGGVFSWGRKTAEKLPPVSRSL